MPGGDLVPFDFGGQGLSPEVLNQNSDPTDWTGLITSVTNYLTKGGGPLPRAITKGLSGDPVYAGGPAAGGGGSVSPGGDLTTTSGSDSDSEITFSQIREDSHDKLGFYVKRKTMQYIIRKMGIVAGAEALGIDQNEAVWLILHRRTTPRRHFVQTMVKQMRKARRFEALLAKVARRQHVGGSRRCYSRFRRKARR